jgi:membrane fusion protein (multidrug efflux system)
MRPFLLPSIRLSSARQSASVILALPLLTLAACKKPVPPAMPPSEVTFITVATKPVEEQLEFTGQVQAYRTAQVRSQAAGVILARPFREGAEVRAGEVLYRIDAISSDAAWRSARARLTEARARLANAELNAKRLRPLLEGNAVAKQDVDNAESQVEQARAAVDDASGAVDAAKKGLDETVVRAPLSGRVGRAQLDVGGRVTGASDVLTTIDVLAPVYVSFRPSSAQQLSWRRDAAMRRALEPGGEARVEASLTDGSHFPEVGRIGYIDPVVDPATGTQEYRAQFDNVGHGLLPGQFVHVRVRGLVRQNAIVVPQRAVLEQMGRQIVYVVGADSKVESREIHATSWTGGDWLIENGLKNGDRVVVDGVQKIGPGAPVKATPLADSAKARSSNDAATPAKSATKASAGAAR